MHFNIVSLFPEFFDSPLNTALMAKARAKNIVNFDFYNPRDYGLGVHKAVDDRPYGGGAGMVMMLEPLLKSLRSIENPGRILVMCPAGKKFNQDMAKSLAKEQNITLVCGRYEGFDARLEQILPVEYVSMGDAVLNGGEVPALAIVEAVARLVPNFMGKEVSGQEESFSDNTLEYPHYTRPDIFEGHAVPEVLLNGNHAHINAWRRKKSLHKTLHFRPDLLNNAQLSENDAQILKEEKICRFGRNLYLALVHHPVVVENKNTGTTSLTNLDIHDIARSARTYGLGGYYIVHPLKDQQEILQGILKHWLQGKAKNSHKDRAEALKNVHSTLDIASVLGHVTELTGVKPLLWASSAQWTRHKIKQNNADDANNTNDLSMKTPCSLSYTEARMALENRPAVLLLGTGQGLAPQVLDMCDGFLRPLRFLGDYNHLSVRAAAAIMLDRILQDIY